MGQKGNLQNIYNLKQEKQACMHTHLQTYIKRILYQQRERWWWNRRTLGLPSSTNTIITIITSKYPRNLKTGKTDSITKDRVVATSKEVIVKTWLGREMDCAHCGREGVTVTEKGERQTITQGNAQGKQIPITIAWKTKDMNFVSSCNEWGLKPGVSKASALGSGRAQRTLGLLLEKRQDKQLADLQYGNRSEVCLQHTVENSTHYLL